MNLLLKIIKAALSHFSKINMVNYVGIATLIIASWQQANLIEPAVVIMITGALTLILKLWESTKEMVSSGYSLDWSVWLSGLVALVIGFTDTFITQGDLLMWLFGDHVNIVIMFYLALTIILRTGFTNQTLNSRASR